MGENKRPGSLTPVSHKCRARPKFYAARDQVTGVQVSDVAATGVQVSVTASTGSHFSIPLAAIESAIVDVDDARRTLSMSPVRDSDAEIVADPTTVNTPDAVPDAVAEIVADALRSRSYAVATDSAAAMVAVPASTLSLRP